MNIPLRRRTIVGILTGLVCLFPWLDGFSLYGPNWCFGLPFPVLVYRPGVEITSVGMVLSFDPVALFFDLFICTVICGAVSWIYVKQKIQDRDKLEGLTLINVFLLAVLIFPGTFGTFDSVLARHPLLGLAFGITLLVGLFFSVTRLTKAIFKVSDKRA